MKLIEVRVDAETAWLVNEQGERIFSRVLSRKAQRWETYLHDRNGERCEVEAAREWRIAHCSEVPLLRIAQIRDLDEGATEEGSEGAVELEVIQPLAWRMGVDVCGVDAGNCALQPIILSPRIGVGIDPSYTLLLDEGAVVAHRFSEDWTPLEPESVFAAIERLLGLESPPRSLRWTGLRCKWTDDEGAARAEG